MKPQAALAAVAALTVAVATAFSPALAARSSYVIDDAHMLSTSAVTQINQQVGDLNARTGKEVLVVTTDSLGGTAPDAAIERSFAQNQVNGVEIFISKNDHVIRIAGDKASSRFFPSGSYQTIAQTMRASFKAGDFDGGVQNAVGVIVNTYRGHTSSLNGNRAPQPVGQGSYATSQRSNSGGSGMGWIWWLIILAVIFFIIRGIFRAIAGPRMGRGYGPGPGYGGGPGYGPGYGGGGFGGGGGGFWSGMLGGLGGAFLGNELFGNRGGGGNVGGVGGADGGSWAGTSGDAGGSADASGWQSDAGQIDTSNIGGASWGDSGGGDSGGGWGGGDSGGGGGDSGGGW